MSDSVSLLTRRRLLQIAGGGYLGLNLGGLWRAQAAAAAPIAGVTPIRSCILVFYYGGPSHLETYDPKPQAPAEVRGEFQTIATSVPGLHIGEHLPRMAKLMHKTALVRSVTHQARLHDSASIHALTGRPLEGPDRELFAPLPQFYPCYGSAIVSLTPRREGAFPFASLPFVFRNVHDVPSQGGGFLGAAHDPLRIEGNPEERRYRAELFQRAEGVDRQRLSDRRQLLAELDRRDAPDTQLRAFYEQAYRLLDSEQIRQALDIEAEPPEVRERYGFGDAPAGGGGGAENGVGRQLRGQNLLLARRLVEAGAPFVNIYDFKQQGQNWDAHSQCFEQHKKHLLPQADQGLSALIEDLDQRGLLDSTLVVAMGEFGRTPTINANAGRDHWPDCYTVLLAGGGVQGGAVYGASDRLGAYPARDPVTPGDLAATIFWRFGLNPATEIYDRTDRPHRLAAGEPIRQLF